MTQSGRLASVIKVGKTSAAIMLLAVGSTLGFVGQATAAACTAPSTDYGKAIDTLSIPGTATYRIWTRMMVPDTTNKTYLLQVDSSTCYNVGGGSIPTNTWTWIDYQGGNAASYVQQSLTQGSHSLTLLGNAPGVKVDRIVALSDLNCVPTGTGDNCNVPSDTAPPTVVLTAPAEGATISGTATLSANATDNVGVTKVEFYDNSTLLATDTTAPYSTSWNSAAAPNGSHLISVRAYDAAGNVSSDSSTVTVKNGDIQAPSKPSNLKASATAYNAIKLTWSASTDNIGVTGYTIYRDGVPVANTGATTSYTDTGLSANTSYTYDVQAFDAAGNKSSTSDKTTAKTLTVADSQAPSKPTGLSATAISSSQINLTWTPATDNIGVTGYDVYRSSDGSSAKLIGTSTTPSFGDPNLSASTSYTYYIIAKDASNNASPASDTATAKTLAKGTIAIVGNGSTGSNAGTEGTIVSTSKITGAITDQVSKSPLAYAQALLVVNNHHNQYQADSFGRYAIFDQPLGYYNITYRAPKYHSRTLSLQLQATPLTQNTALQKK